MRAFPWLPSDAEREEIVTAILGDVLAPCDVPALLAKLPGAPIAFFSDLLVEILAEVSAAEVDRQAQDLVGLVRSGSQGRQLLERHLSSNRMTASAIGELALRIWHDRALATQSHLGE